MSNYNNLKEMINGIMKLKSTKQSYILISIEQLRNYYEVDDSMSDDDLLEYIGNLDD